MSKLLIIGASILQLPAILKAKELGHFVAVADFNPKAIGISFADKYYNASTIDIEQICEVARKFKPEGIMTLATDMPMRSLAAATTLLGIPGITFETSVKATDKGEMIRAFKENGVESPWFHIVNNDANFKGIRQNLTYPCIIKPIDNSGSRGVILVNKDSELDHAYVYSKSQSRNGSVIIEEYLIGNEVSVEVMAVGGVSHILAVTDKLTTGSPYFVEMGHSQQSQLTGSNIESIKNLASRAVKAVGIDFGPAHVEIIVTKNGPRMVELGARLGGDCITTHLVPLSTGIDMVKATIDVALGIKPDIEPRFQMGSAIRYFHVHSGKIKSIEGVEKVKQMDQIKEITFTRNIGDEVPPIHSSLDRVGFVIAQGKNSKEAVHLCDEAIKTIKILVD